jgi:phenylpropionate dioxygenase-like ring-hydroxylating dioxygenase large terminal subunit
MFLTNVTPGLEHAWFAVALGDEVSDTPISVELLGRRWAVLRLDGTLTAFADRCPHRLAPLSIGNNCGAVLQCRYHGWEFTADGTCVRIPSLGADVAIPSATPREPLPDFDEWDDEAFDTCRNEPRRTATSAFQLTDNFLDATHLPTVHTQTFGVADAEYLPPHEVTVDGLRGWTTYDVSYKNHDDPLVATGEHPLVQPQVLYKEFTPVSTALIRLDHPLTGMRIAILFALQPERDGSTRIYKQMARNDFAGDEKLIHESILYEDLVGVHLDLREEVHVRTDRLSVAYRRMLASFVGEPAATVRTGVS